MQYIIFDLEWNQPAGTERSERLPHGEIIQTGFLVLNDELEIVRREEQMIRPVCYTEMNPYVSALTGIKQSDVDKGLDFRTALKNMTGCFAEDTVLITWGDDDMPILRENMLYHGINDIILPPHYNLQRIFAAQTGTHLRQTGLKSAMEALEITDEIKAHDALNDAYMTYLIAVKLDLKAGIRDYGSFPKEPSSKKPPWESVQPVFAVKTAFPGSPGGLSDVCRKMHLCCPACGKDLYGSVIVRHGKNSFIGVTDCRDRGDLFIRFSLKDKTLTASVFELTPELKSIYQNRLRLKEAKDKRREAFRLAARVRKKKNG